MPGKHGKKQVLFDTSIIIGYLRGNKASKPKIKNVRNGKIIGFIIVITVFELYLGAFLSPNRNEAFKDITQLLSCFQPPLDLNESHARKAAYLYNKLRRSNNLIGLNDIFIAATSLTMELPIYTFNIAHFSRIPNLKLVTS